MTVSLNLLGHRNVTIEVPQVQPVEDSPEKVMRLARRRYASQGAERVTLVPRRNGNGWRKKSEDS